MPIELIDRDEFRRLAEMALGSSTAEHVTVSLSDDAGGTTRFANNQVVQNVNTRRQALGVSVAFGQQHGSASTTDLSEASIRQTVRMAEEIAKISPADPEFLPPLEAQRYLLLPTMRPETAAAGPARRIDVTREAIDLCKADGLNAAGIVAAYATSVGLAANSGLVAFEQRSRAQFSLTATGPDSSGWVNNSNRSFDDLGVTARTRTAIEKAKASAKPRELPAGRYTVILEPAAVAGLVGALFGPLNAKSYYKGASALRGKLGERIIDERLSVQNRPDHPSLLGDGFNGYGLPSDQRTWIERGVLKQLDYDRFTAREHDTAPTYDPDAVHLSGAQPVGESVDALVRRTERAILVTNFWYIRDVNPTDLTLTGMTRDGTFLVEGGQIAGGLINFRWHESPLRALNQVEAYTAPLDAITMERDKMLLPALCIRDFNFSSVTRF